MFHAAASLADHWDMIADNCGLIVGKLGDHRLRISCGGIWREVLVLVRHETEQHRRDGSLVAAPKLLCIARSNALTGHSIYGEGPIGSA